MPHLPPHPAGRRVWIYWSAKQEGSCHSIEVVTAMTETPRVGVRLVGLHAPMCQHFHVDHATVRLVCHLRGPDERVARGA